MGINPNENVQNITEKCIKMKNEKGDGSLLLNEFYCIIKHNIKRKEQNYVL